MDYTQRGAVIYGPVEGYAEYGKKLAMAANGTELVIGAPSHSASNFGLIDVYDWSGSAWVQRGILTGDTYSVSSLGSSVALSRDGMVLVVGSSAGLLTFDRSGAGWVQRGTALPGPGNVFTSSGDGGVSALSGDGAVMVAFYTDGSGDGAVLTFDYSGGAWVQRGTALQQSDAGLTYLDGFGVSCALSSDAAVLVVGAKWRDGPLGDPDFGAVYTFDLSGGAWVQRGSEMYASDATAYESFGAALALSSDGAQLRVGSPADKVYQYSLSGGAWVSSGATLGPTDATGNLYGSAVAVSGDATVLAVGAPTWEAVWTGTDAGGVYVYDGSAPVVPTGTATAPTALTVTLPTGIATAPTALSVTASGAVSAQTALAVVDLSAHYPLFAARVVIGGVDLSARVTGRISVTAEEGAARIASLAILPAAGTVEPLDYVGKTIAIDYLQTIAGASVARRLFTGRIDTPAFDPNSQLLSFSCTDDLQNRVAALDRAVIDALVGGKFTTAVQGEVDDNWDYAQARMSTVAASLDASASGGMRVTPWQLATSWATFDESDLLYQAASLEFPQRSTLVNRVDIEFAYRYPRLRQRYANVGWSGTLIDMAPNGYQYPTQQDILGAAGGSGWQVTLGVFYPAPASIAHSSGGFIYPADDAIDLAVLYMTQRHSQTVTESYSLTVSAPESVTANGELAHALRGALKSSFDGQAWESALDVEPLLPTGGDIDHAPDAPRADADYAIETLLDQARVKILGSHRSARVGNAVLLNPELDLDKRITIATAQLAASGKVASMSHVIDLDAGSAITEFEIACFGVGGAGILTPDELAAPAPPAGAAETQPWLSSLPTLMVNTFGVTSYTEGLMGLLLNPPATITVSDVPTADGPKTISYPNPYYVAGSYPVTGFRMQMPGVVDADRNPLDKPVSTSYAITIPADTITITVTA